MLRVTRYGTPDLTSTSATGRRTTFTRASTGALSRAGILRRSAPTVASSHFGSIAPTMVGPFDERYFLYDEKTEWSFRMRRHGLRILIVPQARAWHNAGHGVAGGSAAYHYYMTRNRLLFVSENGEFGACAALYRSAKDSILTYGRLEDVSQCA